MRPPRLQADSAIATMQTQILEVFEDLEPWSWIRGVAELAQVLVVAQGDRLKGLTRGHGVISDSSS